MIIASDITNHLFLTKFPLENFIPFPSLITDFIPRHAAWATPPINRIPVELLTHIFFFTLRHYDVPGWQPPISERWGPVPLSFSPSHLSDPMDLAKVCRKWRYVALSTPMLWSSMSIWCDNMRGHIPLLRTWLERSAACPLTIVLGEPSWSHNVDDWWPQQNAMATEILALLISHAHRWKAIDFRFTIKIPSILANLPADKLKLLECAKVISHPSPSLFFDDFTLLDKMWGAIYKAPCFSQAKWDVEFLHHRFQTIPWARLTRVDVTMLTDSLLDILPLCHNLMELHFKFTRVACFMYPDDDWSAVETYRHSQTHVVLPQLRKLAIIMDYSPDFLFQRLTLPSLLSCSIDLRLPFSSSATPSDSSVFRELLERSHCRPRELYFKDFSGEDNLIDILKSPWMSCLIDLSVVSRSTEKLAQSLTRTGTTDSILPRLEGLELQRSTASPDTLAHMIHSRRQKLDSFSLLRDVKITRWYHKH
ncbi:hypothetical protein D9615_006936 [Tricholomella constricta]|uniref:F-box domain-containing protein n=1 Tax=Tricholomella constricta TaxID=117010 RepID=A0A8H5H8M5_9AGAR|nr:hypothetical protein D9615_006936 [Tricholomella constricta]